MPDEHEPAFTATEPPHDAQYAPRVEVLARGPWPIERVRVHWRAEHYTPSAAHTAAADAALAVLRERGSPSHDGLSARLLDYRADEHGIEIELQPARWALRLVPEDAGDGISTHCIMRSAGGRWLAGRRAPWLAEWAGRWALGAGGAVDLEENPAETLVRELNEEWSVAPARAQAEALVRLPEQLIMFVGQAWLPAGAEVVPNHEHDAHAWWPAAIEDWPPEADERLRQAARWLAG